VLATDSVTRYTVHGARIKESRKRGTLADPADSVEKVNGK